MLVCLLLYHPLFEYWYIDHDHGLVVDKIYGYIESKKYHLTFNNFGDIVSNERRCKTRIKSHW